MKSEDLMSLVTFENNNNNNNSNLNGITPKQTQCDINLPNIKQSAVSSSAMSTKDCYPLSNYYDYCNTMDSSNLMMNRENGEIGDLDSNLDNVELSTELRTTRSAPPSPTPQKKKQRPTSNLPWSKPW